MTKSIDQMTILELKGGILDLVSQLEDEQSLTELLSHVGKLVHDENEFAGSHWSSLTENEQERMIKAAGDFSDGKSEGIPHQTILEKHRKWL